MSVAASLVGGIACKMYDDITDNDMLSEFKRDTFLEFLKGIHYITFTSVSIKHPLFFYIQYIGNFVNYLSNNDAFSRPYEHSAIFSFLLLFLLVDHTQRDKINTLDSLMVLGFISTMFMEPIFNKYIFNDHEFSKGKLIIRLLLLFGSILYFSLGSSDSSKVLFAYYIGYFLISVTTQYYSLCREKRKSQ